MRQNFSLNVFEPHMCIAFSDPVGVAVVELHGGLGTQAGFVLGHLVGLTGLEFRRESSATYEIAFWFNRSCKCSYGRK